MIKIKDLSKKSEGLTREVKDLQKSMAKADEKG